MASIGSSATKCSPHALRHDASFIGRPHILASSHPCGSNLDEAEQHAKSPIAGGIVTEQSCELSSKLAMYSSSLWRMAWRDF